MFGGGLGGFSDFFETLFGMSGGQSQGLGGLEEAFAPRRARPRDSEHTVQISLEEAFNGTTRTLQWEDGRRIEAKIPPGVHSGSRVRLKGQGEGRSHSSAGDLYLKVDVATHPVYRREGDDLRMTHSRSDVYTAVLGGEVDVAALDKRVKIDHPTRNPEC